MANPKVMRECRQCGVTREHYTRRNGRIISPCAECQIAKAKVRQDQIRDDPDKLERQRQEWARIKRRQRMIDRGEVGVAKGEPAVQPASISMAERRRRRARAKAQAANSTPKPPDAKEPDPPAPSRRRGKPVQGASPVPGNEAPPGSSYGEA